MSIEMLRIDDRFIHGQVIVGWCPEIKPDRLILCDDSIAKDEWEKEIYRDAAHEYDSSVFTVEETAALLKSYSSKSERIFVLVESPGVAVELLKHDVSFGKVTVGGMHFQPGKRRVTTFIYVSDEDVENFRILAQHGIKLEGKDVPGCKPLNLNELLQL